VLTSLDCRKCSNREDVPQFSTTFKLAQTNNDSELPEVQATPWELTVYYLLLKRYTCIDSSNNNCQVWQRALTRSELGEAFYGLQEKINQIFASGQGYKFSTGELAMMRRLQKEYASELADRPTSNLADIPTRNRDYEDLANLARKYDCPAKYILQKQELTRQEFAAALNACLNKINEIISSGLADKISKISKQDLATLQRLQDEYVAELADIRGHAENIELLPKHVSGEKPQQFSATTQTNNAPSLSDVQPNDWAFTALESLSNRYGCIAGYSAYRGRRAMTRYEFAAGLNACLEKISEIIASGLADKFSKEDLAALQILQEEFAPELAALNGRQAALEAKAAQLEAQQFSTTSNLSS
jgi:hypothetical protein